MIKLEVGQSVETNYKIIPNQTGTVESVFDRTVSIRNAKGELSHHRLNRIKLIGGNNNEQPDSF